LCASRQQTAPRGNRSLPRSPRHRTPSSASRTRRRCARQDRLRCVAAVAQAAWRHAVATAAIRSRRGGQVRRWTTDTGRLLSSESAEHEYGQADSPDDGERVPEGASAHRRWITARPRLDSQERRYPPRRHFDMACAFCGTLVPDGAMDCPSCGRATAWLRDAVADAPGLDGPTQTSPAERLTVGQLFSTRYRIIRLLGVGGMGAVYQAWDEELSVAVALKVIRRQPQRGSTSAEAEKRFKTELLLARQVTHKNVVRIHDIGEID